jgi:uncharacterized Zn finger protein/superfamily II DNA or RNA helicase
MSKKYGVTWWGQQWLNALSNIDNSNRLPRGKTYANTGRVRSVEIQKNVIEAKVQGSDPRPYKITITIPLFSENEKKEVVNEAIRNPVVVAKLLNRELPQEMLSFSESKGIKVFPKSWRDFGMKCSCPDSAVPCKHLAAVVYTVAEEIDRNPFMVFDVHGLDLVKELEKNNLKIGDKQVENIPSVLSLLEKNIDENKENDAVKKEVSKAKKTKKATSSDAQSVDSQSVTLSDYSINDLDFTQIPDTKADILSLLKPQPLFYAKDFKVVIEKLYHGTDRAARKILRGDIIIAKKAVEIGLDDTIQLIFDDILLLQKVVITDKNEKSEILSKEVVRNLVHALISLNVENRRLLSPTLATLYDIFYFSLHLAKNGAIMPQLLEVAKHTYRVRWLPAIINENVKTQFDILAANMPSSLSKVVIGNAEKRQNATETLNSLCALFIGYCVSEGATVTDGGVISLFSIYNATPQYFKNDTPQLIQLWLNNFYITHKEHVPLLKVEENENGGFDVSILIENRQLELVEPVPLKDIFQKKTYETVKFDVLKDLMLLSDYFPKLNSIVESQGTKHLSYDNVSFVSIMLKTLPALGLFGIRILLPRGLKHLVRPQATLLAKQKFKDNKPVVSFLNFDDLVSFDWQIALGGERLSVKDFSKMVVGLNGIVKLKDQYVLVQEEDLKKMYKKLENPPDLRGLELFKTVIAEEYEGVKIGLTDEAAAFVKGFVHPETVPLPLGLKANLRPYQIAGYEWLLKNTRIGFGSLLADDMGLGKTLQVIATLLKFKEEGMIGDKKKALVIVPTSLLTNWMKEIEKFAPELRGSVYHGQKRIFTTDDIDVVITTYGIVRNEQDILKKTHWYCAVIDEAQNIKNPDTEQTKCVKNIKSDVRIAMSGTPVENRLSEFWSILDYTNKGYLGALKKFNDDFGRPIQRDHDQKQAVLFKKITAPFMLRRLKSDKKIIADLPDKIENNQYSTLTSEQAAIYQNVVNESMKIIYDESETIARQGLVLKMITALKQICNHPYQFLKKGKRDPNLSGKMDMLFSLLDNIYESKEKTLIFTQYHEMGDLLSRFINENYGIKPLFLHGGSSRPQRDAMVEAFQNDPSVSTFILSLKAGGTGLNLTAAANVIHYDLWWNPAVEAQATDRAYRIGQKSNVMVYRLITQGTFEEKIDEMLKLKKQLADMTVSVGENWIGNMSNSDLKALVSLD